MSSKVPLPELLDRIRRIRERMDTSSPDWEIALIFGKINQYYFTGTMQDGVLFIPRDGDPIYWVRRSYDRARDESPLPDIRPMRSFRDIANVSGSFPRTCHLETEIVPIALLDRFRKHIPFTEYLPLDREVGAIRAEKSPYEIRCMRRAGRIHATVLEEHVPGLLREGMSEADLGCALQTVLMEEGHHGIIRFGMFDTEVILGQIAFGTHSLHPTSLHSPGGAVGLSPAVPHFGSRDRRLEKGDLVFLDIGAGYAGYHTDKTVVYQFGSPLSGEAARCHQRCLDLEEEIASLLRPGMIPQEIYRSIMDRLPQAFHQSFMGFAGRRVHFLGHGIGLQVDEFPVIAEGFEDPLATGMAIAIEPKIGVAGVGMVGSENTYLVQRGGGESITGRSQKVIEVGF